LDFAPKTEKDIHKVGASSKWARSKNSGADPAGGSAPKNHGRRIRLCRKPGQRTELVCPATA